MDRSVLKALAVLNALGTSSDGKHLTDLAQELDFPVSTTHRLLATLASQGYVEKDNDSGRYVLGSAILRLQVVTADRLNLTRTAFPFLRTLAEEVDETVNLSILSDGSVVYLESVAADRAVGLYAPPGTIAPAHCTAMGNVLLANLSAPELENWFSRNELTAATPYTIVEQDALLVRLETVRERGYALDEEEWVRGVRCIAGPIRGHAGKVTAAISVSAPRGRLTPDREHDVIEAIKSKADEISTALGHR